MPLCLNGHINVYLNMSIILIFLANVSICDMSIIMINQKIYPFTIWQKFNEIVKIWKLTNKNKYSGLSTVFLNFECENLIFIDYS